MFSMEEKKLIAQKVEEILLSLNHPEMPTEKPKFTLNVKGAESWSWAEIEPNWVFEDGKKMGHNPWNEDARKIMPKRDQ